MVVALVAAHIDIAPFVMMTGCEAHMGLVRNDISEDLCSGGMSHLTRPWERTSWLTERCMPVLYEVSRFYPASAPTEGSSAGAVFWGMGAECSVLDAALMATQPYS